MVSQPDYQYSDFSNIKACLPIIALSYGQRDARRKTQWTNSEGRLRMALFIPKTCMISGHITKINTDSLRCYFLSFIKPLRYVKLYHISDISVRWRRSERMDLLAWCRPICRRKRTLLLQLLSTRLRHPRTIYLKLDRLEFD